MLDGRLASSRVYGAICAALGVIHPAGAETPPEDCEHRWQIPADVRSMGATQSVAMEPAEGCGTGPSPGAEILAAALMDMAAPVAVGVDIFDCRYVGGSTSTWSLHAEGRAIDIDIRTDPGAYGGANNLEGDLLANWLVENAHALGIMKVVWDRTSWRANGSAPSGECSTGVNPHHDHIHVELSWAAADALTPWFFGAPTTSLSGRRDGHDLVVIDQDNELNQTGDHRVEVPADFRWSDNVSGAWANGYAVGPTATHGEPVRFWFREAQPRCYRVDAWWTDAPDRAHATFVAHDARGTLLGSSVNDQSLGGDHWNTLGTWRFTTGWNHVDLQRSGPEDAWLVADALRLVPAPCPMSMDTPRLAAGEAALLTARDVQGPHVWFMGSITPGETEVPGCPGLTVPMARAHPIARGRTDGAGTASAAMWVPVLLAGERVRLAAVDTESCVVTTADVQIP